MFLVICSYSLLSPLFPGVSEIKILDDFTMFNKDTHMTNFKIHATGLRESAWRRKEKQWVIWLILLQTCCVLGFYMIWHFSICQESVFFLPIFLILVTTSPHGFLSLVMFPLLKPSKSKTARSPLRLLCSVVLTNLITLTTVLQVPGLISSLVLTNLINNLDYSPLSPRSHL